MRTDTILFIGGLCFVVVFIIFLSMIGIIN